MTGGELELLAGKPSQLMMHVALETLGLLPRRCMMVGDRLETDIRMGQAAGMFTAATLTGASTPQQAQAMSPAPDFIIGGLLELLDLVE